MDYNKVVDVSNQRKNVTAVVVLILVILGMSILSPFVSYAEKTSGKASEKAQEKGEENDAETTEEASSIREVHKVKVKNKKYCFFAEKNAILTPEEIAAMTDEKLVAVVIARSGLYMRKSNCTKESNSNITPAEWIKKGGSFWLDKNDIKSIRNANAQKGKPVKLYMDLKISTEHESKKAVEKRKKEAEDAAKEAEEKKKETDPAATDSNVTDSTAGESQDNTTDSKQENTDNNKGASTSDDYTTPRLKYFSTYKKTAEPLLFVVVATAADAKEMPGYCLPGKQSYKEAKNEAETSEPEEILPEYRTINMTDRSGGPIPATLQDGEPVTLTWEEPKHSVIDSEGAKTIIDKIPGRYAGLICILGALFVLGLVITKLRRDNTLR